MRDYLLLFSSVFTIGLAFAQPAGMLNETFKLKFIETNNLYYTPNGENPDFTIYEVAGNYVMEASGIFNVLNAAASFSGNTISLNDFGGTLHDCTEPNCYYEDLYFYEILTNPNLEPKTLTYYYNERNGFKYLSLQDSNYNWAYFSTEPLPEPDSILYQTWYLYMTEVDLGDPVFYGGPNPPQITINPDFSYTGLEGCMQISGDFILGNGEDYDFILQSINYQQDTSNCPPGPVNYVMYDLMYSNPPLSCTLYTGNDGIDYFEYESYGGFISYFRNELLSVDENSLADLKLFPNPVKNTLILHATNDFTSAVITDINGRKINSLNKLTSNQIDVSNLTAGLYFITLTAGEGRVTKKFIKK